MKPVFLQPAFVLHRYAYRETSFLVELFTLEHGRLTVVANGVRKARSATQGLLQPFLPLLVSWTGKHDLMRLTAVEMHGQRPSLQGECLFAGFYLNELLFYLLQKWDVYENLYTRYTHAIASLQTNRFEQKKILRSFEKYLLEVLGYGVLPTSDLALRQAFSPEEYYSFIPEQGFIVSHAPQQSHTKLAIFSGKNLLAIAREDWSDEAYLHDAKRLLQFALAILLGSKKLHSRRLFI